MYIKQKSSQKGLAAIIFVIMFPFMFGIFILGVEGSRYMQEHARLGDAAEAASLAIAANNGNAASNKKFALDFVNAYSDDATLTLSDISIVEKTCKQIYGNNCGKPGVYDKDGNQFVEYKVAINTKYQSFFPGSDYHQGFDENQAMSANSVARKFRGDTVDVAFVGDFSGSMYSYWNGQRKYKGVLNVINNISDELDQFNKLDAVSGSESRSQVAFIGYNSYTSDGVNYYSNLTYTGNSLLNYILGATRLNNLIDLTSTINYVSTAVTPKIMYNYRAPGARFKNVPLTSDITSFKSDIKNFQPNYGTSSYEGLISAARIISEGVNRKKLIFILSDGADNYQNVANNLYNGGLCDNIRKDLNSKVISGKNVESAIVVIGFGYNISSNPGIQTCAGSDNVYSAVDYDDIFNTILELIMEEVGHNYSKDYKV
ncbi:pilus assembly protein TadG-related protein [Marinomonas sp. 15G1-11]|uniref:Pilus assembly protein TadG-related protein n=1 Tax=Marinomonas phaeophyticola TaxID=3004091 RepID=A0ABT4JWY2_9GAMM|nr:pilus assembly protein TadG-related protein [Marinomonas sp. 15G1-11]MCZ2722870.1 pilus assembly protein TadG-related protein [Marinomonas sp. 15G1-11]